MTPRITPRAGAALAALCLVFSTAGCLNSNDGKGTEGAGIHLTGRVVGRNGAPVSGVSVILVRNGAADTTDAQGRYIIRKAEPGEAALEGALDTLVFRQGLQKLASVKVSHWIDELPDINVVQRDISGLLRNGQLVSRVEAVVYTEGEASSDTVVTPFFYNPLSSNYSGFVYFPPPVGLRHYATYVNIYGDGGRFIGRSRTVPFNSHAGNITVPEFSANNALPYPDAGRDTAVAVNSALALRAAAVDSFGGTIVKREWNIGGAGFVETSGDTSILLPAARTNAYPVVLRVTDNDGNVSQHARAVKVTNDDPLLTALPDTVVGLNAPVTLRVAGSDNQGVVRYFWDFNGDGVNDDTTLTGTATHVFPGTARASRVVVTAEDPFDGVTRDTVIVTSLSSGIEWTGRAWEDTTRLMAVTWTGSQLVAVGYRGVILTSPDGIAWTRRTSGTERNLTSVASNGHQIIALAMGSSPGDSSALVSTDGVNWSPSPGPSGSGSAPLQNLSWVNGRYFSATSSGLASSEDGFVWTRSSPLGANNFASGIVWTGSRYVFASGSLSATSLDGVSWTRHTLGSVSLNTGGLVWTGTRLVALSNGAAYVSADGSAWTRNASVVHTMVFSSVWTGDQIVSVGASGSIFMSPDQGDSWVRKTHRTRTFNSMAWTGTRLVAVGDGGTIVTSP
jgi:hypothetical protein